MMNDGDAPGSKAAQPFIHEAISAGLRRIALSIAKKEAGGQLGQSVLGIR